MNKKTEKTSEVIPPKIAAVLDLAVEMGRAAYEVGQDGKRRIRFFYDDGTQMLFEPVESGLKRVE